MKKALCLSGQARFWPNFQIEYFKDFDIFIHSWTYNDDRIIERNSCYGHTNLNTRCYKTKWSANQDLLNFFKPICWKFEEFSKEAEDIFLGKTSQFIRIEGNGGCRNGVLPMFYSIHECGKLLGNRLYDLIVRARFDSRFRTNPIIYNDLSKINIPQDNKSDWAGINDQFAFGNLRNMAYYFKLYKNLEDVIANKRANRIQLNPEVLLKKHLRQIPLERYNLEFWLER